MALGIYQNTITLNNSGQSVPSAVVQINNTSPNGTGLATLWEDRAGTMPAGNPVTADANGKIAVYLEPSRYKITVTAPSGSAIYEDVELVKNDLSQIGGNINGNAIVSIGDWLDAIWCIDYADLRARLLAGTLNAGDWVNVASPLGPPGIVEAIGLNVDNNGLTTITGGTLAWKRSIPQSGIDPKWGEAPTDGTTDATAILSLAGTLGNVTISDKFAVAGALSFASQVSFALGGRLNVGAAGSVAINTIEAPIVKIFEITTGGTVTLNKKYAETSWFGAISDGKTDKTDNGPLFQSAVDAVGRTGVVVIDTGDIDNHYHFDTTVILNQDELTLKGRQFRARLGADSDIVILSQPDRLPEAHFGLFLQNMDVFNNVASGSSACIELNRSFLFILDNIYGDKGPSHGINFVGICAQGSIVDGVMEEFQGSGYNETSGSVLLSYRDCQSFKNGVRGFSSGGNANTYGNSLVGCKAFLNGEAGFNRGDAGVSMGQCLSRNNGQTVAAIGGITLGSSATNGSIKGCNSIDDQAVKTQAYGYTINHYSQDLDSPLGSGNITSLVNNNGALPAEVISSGSISLPSVPQNSIIRVDTESGAATDNLDDISRGYTNQILTLRTEDNARNVTYRNAVATLALNGDFTSTSTKSRLVIQYDRTENRWVEISRSAN